MHAVDPHALWFAHHFSFDLCNRRNLDTLLKLAAMNKNTRILVKSAYDQFLLQGIYGQSKNISLLTEPRITPLLPASTTTTTTCDIVPKTCNIISKDWLNQLLLLKKQHDYYQKANFDGACGSTKMQKEEQAQNSKQSRTSASSSAAFFKWIMLGVGATWAVRIARGSIFCFARENHHYDDEEGTESKNTKAKLQESNLFSACRNGNLDVLTKLIHEGIDLNARHEFGWTPLMVAVVNKKANIVQSLLFHGADPDLKDAFSKTSHNPNFVSYYRATHVRSSEFSSELNQDADVEGLTALHYAVLMDCKPIIELLYEYGVRSDIKDSTDHLAKDYSTDQSRIFLERCEQSTVPSQLNKPSLHDQLRTVLVGQNMAIDQVTSVISRLHTKWFNDKHPLVLLFVGATGLGKTETAKQIAKYLYPGVDNSFTHINLSEYQTKAEAAKITGAPPGYVGYGSKGEGHLVTALAKNPKSVVLFDEADKAHPDVLVTLLQLFDEGRITSGSGKTIDCPEAIFILTANIGSNEIKEFNELIHRKSKSSSSKLIAKREKLNKSPTVELTDKQIERAMHEFKNHLMHNAVKNTFKRDEFLGRVNELVVFLPFSETEIKSLVHMELINIKSRAAVKHGVSLSWDEAVIKRLSRNYNETYGARHLKYEIDRLIVDKLARAQEQELITPGVFLNLSINSEGWNKNNPVGLERYEKDGTLTHLDIQMLDIQEIFNVNNCNNNNNT